MLELSLARDLISKVEPDLEAPGAGSLTSREQQILELILAGETNRRIAERLFISPETVKTHVRHILAKTGAARKADLRAMLPAHIP